MVIRMSNFRHIGHHLVFWSPDVKSDDIIEFLDLGNHKVDTNIGSLAVIELELWSFKCQISAILAAILFFWSSDVKSDDIIGFLDLENHKDDTNIRSLAVIELEILQFEYKISAILAAILFSDRPMLNLMTSLDSLTSKTIMLTPILGL